MSSIRVLFAFVALSLLSVAQAAQSNPISHNAAVRRHVALNNHSNNPNFRRSIPVAQGKRIVAQKRQTAEQIAQAAALQQWNDQFHADNAAWQQAAIAALNAGQTPPTFDQYVAGKNGSSSSGSSSNASSDAGSSDAGSSDASSDQSSQAPAQQQSQQASTTPATTNDSTKSNSSSNNNSSSDSSDDCEDDSSSSSSTSSTPAATPAAAGSGSKNAAASPSPSPSSSSPSTSGSFSGQATYYAPGLGACGWTNGPSDYIVAISHSLFDSFGTGNPNNNPACGHKIKATANGKSITVTVADRCEGCQWGDLDFTPTGFQQLADLSVGRLNGLEWSWEGAAP